MLFRVVWVRVMRVSVLGFRSVVLMRGAAIGLIAGFGAGCSSDFARFAPTSADYTGSVNQKQIIFKEKAAPQPFPDDVAASDDINQPVYTGSVENGSIRPTASTVKRTVLSPVASAPIKKFKQPALEPVSAARQAVTEPSLEAPVKVAKKATRKIPAVDDGVDETVTGSVKPKKIAAEQDMADAAPVKKIKAVKPSAEPAQEGWSTIGGTWITVKEGETVYNLAKRFGVPANAILEANNLPKASSLQSGKKVIIPTYIYSNTAKVSAPDNNTETQLARSTTGNVTDVPAGKAPLPKKLPAHNNVAVLPTPTTLKTKQVAATETDAAGKLKVVKPAEAAAAKPNAATPGAYTVASGDSLYVIAKKNGTTVDRLKAANGLTDGKLKIGQVLKVPAAGETVVAAADPGVDPIITGSAATAPKKPVVAPAAEPKAEKAAAPSAEVMDEAEKDTAAAPNATGISKLRWPVRGRTLVGYGQADAGRTNDGLDISVPMGTPVKAAENGVVIYAGTGLKDFGNTVLIRHENGLVTVYGHNGDLMVKRGETIKRGQEIARSGMSGSTKVPKLHFEVRKNSKPINPVTYLE